MTRRLLALGLGPFLLRPSTSSSSEMVRVAKRAAEACVTSRGVLENMRRVVCAGSNITCPYMFCGYDVKFDPARPPGCCCYWPPLRTFLEGWDDEEATCFGPRPLLATAFDLVFLRNGSCCQEGS